jgi:hypothetical protein
MHDLILNSGEDTLLFAIPFIGMLIVGFFRLDELLAAPRTTNKPLHAPRGVDRNGEQILCDPDGTPWTNPSFHR